ncbi:MAG: LysR substrate-binding domain-containing protein, partial [Gammaproteobacteria bacterium]
LFAGDIDMIVGRLPSYRHRTKLVQEKLLDDRIVAVVGHQHPLAKSRSLRFARLKPFGWILPPLETTLRRQVDQFFMDQQQYVPPTVLESVSYLTNRSLLQTRDLIGLMPNQVVAQDVRQAVLVRLNWEVPFGNGPVGLSHRGEDTLSPASLVFLKALRQAARTPLSA